MSRVLPTVIASLVLLLLVDVSEEASQGTVILCNMS